MPSETIAPGLVSTQMTDNRSSNSPSDLQNVDRVTELQSLYAAWPENKFYYSQLWSYIRIPCPETRPLRPLGLQSFTEHQIGPNGSSSSTASRVDTTHNQTEPAVELLPLESRGDSPIPEGDIAVLVVEGLPSPSTIRQLAVQFEVRPELLIGHLELETLQNKRSSFELPALASRRNNLVHVRLVSLWRTTAREKVRVSPKARKQVTEAFRKREKEVFVSERYKSTRVRRVHLHDSQHFTIEQMVSFCLIDKNDEPKPTRYCLFMLDKGSPSVPSNWDACLRDLDFGTPSMVSAVRYNEPLDAEARPKMPRTTTSGDITHNFHPCLDCNTPEIYRGLRNNPIVGLYTLLASAALSWSQVLNYIDDDIDENQDAEDNDSSGETLSQIRFNVRTIHRFEAFIRRDLGLLQDVRDWALEPESTTVSPSQPSPDLLSPALHAEMIRSNLIRDYKSLVEKCQLLVERCESSSNVLQSAVQLEEAQRSMGQTSEVNKLSRVVFVFAPLSFLAAIFGMNVREITPAQAAPSLWHFGVPAICVLAISILFSFAPPSWNRLRVTLPSSFRGASYHRKPHGSFETREEATRV